MVYYGILWYIMIYYDILWYIMVYYERSWDHFLLVYYYILWYIKVYYDILWYIMVYYGILFVMTQAHREDLSAIPLVKSVILGISE